MSINRRQLFTRAGQTAAILAASPIVVPAATSNTDSLAMQLYKSLTDEQREKICLPRDHQRRQYISNWWYIHAKHRLNNTFNDEQRDLIQQVFDGLHNSQYREAINKQVEIDQYGREKNSPSIGFFGSPSDTDFEFIFTGHHVTRRCNPHRRAGQSLTGGPLFYGHFFEQFRETKDHPHNPYWYQGKLFNEFVQTLEPAQQAVGLATVEPRSEKPDVVIKINDQRPGLACRTLDDEHKSRLLATMGKMLAMFRPSDVEATIEELKQRNLIDELHLSWYGGKFDIGSDEVWDTWTIEGPHLVWYYRGQPHIHSYFHLKPA